MRHERLRYLAPFFALAGALGAAGCYDLLGDRTLFREGPDVLGTGSSGGTGTTSTTVPTNCQPSNISSPVDDSCGVFVSSSKGKDTNKGTKEEPLATLAKALELAGGQPIYACAETFTEAVALKNDATLYGGLDCATDWGHAAPVKKTTWTADADATPLHVLAGARLKAEDFALVALDAKKAGSSSIAVLAEAGTQLDLSQCDVSAGNGAAGAGGSETKTPAANGIDGNAGGEACSAGIVTTAEPQSNACDASDPNDDSTGGAGGIGQQNSGGDGSSGQPDGAMNGGKGEGAMACVNGTAGDDGAPGKSGLGASGNGKLGPEGFAGVSGGDGEKGKPGQGGGGGGGTKGVVVCAAEMTKGGASGGSGASGGCPGLGGKGGQAGGSSIGIVSLGAQLFFEGVTITAANGGNGGDGAAGQLGGSGGSGGKGGSAKGAPGTILGCGGGPGGQGGDGGKARGLGGSSIGIAHTGDAPTMEGATLTVGKAGDGGAGDGPKGNGAAGVAKTVQAF